MNVVPVINVECFDPGQGPTMQPLLAQWKPDPANQGFRDYGNRHGLQRLVEVFTSVGASFSVALNALALEREPWVWPLLEPHNPGLIAHGLSNSQLIPAGSGEDAEEAYVRETLDRIERITGRRPSAWLSPGFRVSERTPDVLARCGIRYSFDHTGSDDIVELPSGMKLFPYSMAANDFSLVYTRGLTSRQFSEELLDHVRQLVGEGKSVASLGLHTFLAGMPAYAYNLRRALEGMTGARFLDHETLLA